MTAWARAGRTAASPSRLARSAPPLRGFGLDRLSPARRGLAKRSRFEMSVTAPFLTVVPGGRRALPDRHGLFAWKSPGAMLPRCPDHASPSASCPTMSTSRPNPGLASAGRRSMISRPGPSRTIGPSAFRLRRPRWTYSRRGSATSSTNCSGPADNLSGVLL
jgi:hypothetical protein